MKKLLSTLTILSASFGLATAEDFSAKNPAPPLVAECTAFDPGFEFSAYVGASFATGEAEDNWGGGISVAYFYTENIGTDFSWQMFDYDKTAHFLTADMVIRFPMKTACFAPYIIGGGGFATAQAEDNAWLWRLGGGVDFRPAALGDIGIFADGVYNFLEGDYVDATFVRVGLRFPF